jgi:hypothetical protein
MEGNKEEYKTNLFPQHFYCIGKQEKNFNKYKNVSSSYVKCCVAGAEAASS